MVLYFDVGLDGSYLCSLFVCPIWIFVSVIRSLIKKPGWPLALLRIAIPVVTFGISDANMTLQWKIGNENGDRIVAACEEFHAAQGRYPKTLDDLVPQYLPSVPPAKYCLGWDGNFHYTNSDDRPFLWWSMIGFYTKNYSFELKRWGHTD